MAEEERARKLKIAEEAQREAEEREKVKAEREKRRKKEKEKRRRLANQTYKDDYSGLKGSGRLRRGSWSRRPRRKARGRPP